MNSVRERASLSSKTVTKISKDGVNRVNKRPRRVSTPKATRVKVTCWSDGVDPRIVAQIKKMNVKPAYIQVVSPVEVIIHNNPIVVKK